jgi:transcriptional antiterminator NusG
MNSISQIDCSNWFVLSTEPGSEYKLKESIHSFAGDTVSLYLPCRELCHRVNGHFRVVTKPIFPGYLFLYKELETLLIKSRHSSLERRLHPIRYNNTFAMVEKHEMAFLLELAGVKGLVKTSQAIVAEDNTVIIIDGPLKKFTGQILYINRRKRKARIMVEMLNRQVPVTLGLDILQPDRRS